MVKRGKLTTLTSDIALGVAGIILAGSVTTNVIAQIIIAGVPLGLAILDVKYPEFMDKLNKELDGEDEDESESEVVTNVSEGQGAIITEDEAQ